MYQDSQTTTPTLLVFNPDAKIVIADRAKDSIREDFGIPVEVSAEYLSQALRDRWFKSNNYDAANVKISKVIAAVKEAAAESDSEELNEFLQDLANILHISLTKTYRVSLTFSVDAEIELPIGSDESEVDADDFNIVLEYNNYDGELTDWETTDTRLDSCEPNSY
jgi:hypothetical protein